MRRLARLLSAPVATTYLHTDAYPSDDELAVGPIGYQGSKAAMGLLSKADTILAVGTRLSGFGTLPQYGFDYFPKGATIIQIDLDPRQLGRAKRIGVGIIGDAKASAKALADRLAARHGRGAARTPSACGRSPRPRRPGPTSSTPGRPPTRRQSARAAPSRSSPRCCPRTRS